jgi:hypothetical protein
MDCIASTFCERKCEGSLVKLEECDRDVTSHLEQFQASCEIISESQLIAARLGRFSSIDGHICQTHRDLYGIRWRSTKKCTLYHKKPNVRNTGLSYQQAKYLCTKEDILLPIGQGNHKFKVLILSGSQ